MILSRFWYFVLVVVATLATASTLLATNLINDQWRQSTVNDLVRDRFEIEATLKLDARARLDALAPLAANPDVRTALRTATGRREAAIERELSNGLRTKLTELNSQLAGQAGDLLFATDANGWIVAGIAPGNIPEGAGLGSLPVVRRALEGNVSDDLWVYNDEVYRMAARPVVEGGQFVGAIVHGKRIDEDLARNLSQRLDGASIGFFRGDAMFAGAMGSAEGAPRRDDMGQQLGGEQGVLQQDAETLGEGGRTDPRPLDTGGLAVYSLMVGSARHARVGYAIGRPVRSLGHAWDITTQMSGEQWAALPWHFILPIAVFMLILTMLSVWLEHDRPLSRLRGATGALSGAPGDRLTTTDFGGRFRRVTENVNVALDKLLDNAGTAGPKRKKANLDEILGPTPDEQPSGGFYGFAQDGSSASTDLPEVPPAQPAGPGAATSSPQPAGGLPAPGGSPGRPPPPKPPTPPAGRAKPTALQPKPEAPAATPPTEDSPKGAAAVLAPPPATGRRKALKRTLLGVPPANPDDDDDDEGATMVANIPKELIEKASGGGGDGGEEAHFREVFQQFVSMKQKCGEPTAGLTFEKFSVTLRKNRDQIVQRHGAAKVRFTVYEKNGKAALKATPIRS